MYMQGGVHGMHSSLIAEYIEKSSEAAAAEGVGEDGGAVKGPWCSSWGEEQTAGMYWCDWCAQWDAMGMGR